MSSYLVLTEDMIVKVPSEESIDFTLNLLWNQSSCEDSLQEMSNFLLKLKNVDTSERSKK